MLGACTHIGQVPVWSSEDPPHAGHRSQAINRRRAARISVGVIREHGARGSRRVHRLFVVTVSEALIDGCLPFKFIVRAVFSSLLLLTV
jgi:hypothetical protein